MTDKIPEIDNKFLNKLADSIEELHETISQDVRCLRDEKEDIFRRYMAFCRTETYLRSMEFIVKLHNKNFLYGHAVQHPYFQTKEAIKRGWNEPRMEDHPFFVTPDESHEMDDSFRQMLAQALANSILGLKKDSKTKKKKEKASVIPFKPTVVDK